MKSYNKTGGSCWSADRAWDWYSRQGWLRGFNYVPAYAGNSTEFWQEDDFNEYKIANELKWASDWGYNTARVFLQYIVWRDNPEKYKERIDRFLSIAVKKGISTLPVIFDDCAAYKAEYLHRWTLDGVGLGISGEPKDRQLLQWRQPELGLQPAPVPGVHNSVWTPCPGSAIADDPKQYPDLRNYTRDIIGSFGTDERVLMWDLYNEPHNASRKERSIPLVEDSFTWAREVNPDQPLTICIGFAFDPVDQIAAEQSDIVSFHSYSAIDTLKEQVEGLKKLGYPLLLTEWMARTYGSSMKEILPYLNEEKIGCYQWGLVSGKTQTRFPWTTQKGTPEPDLWFHDIMRSDGAPYDIEEYRLMNKLCKIQEKPI
jgi:hypothetical protein